MEATGPTVTPVLLFHDVVVGPSPDRWTLTVAHFEACLDAIVESGRLPGTASEIAAHLREPGAQSEPRCAITFDDGYASFGDIALPMLAERGLPATTFVTTGHVGSPNFVSRSALADLADRKDVEVGAHTVNHRHLDLLSPAQARAEIVGSRDQLAEIMGNVPASFAYPHGSFKTGVREIVREAGFDNCYAVKNAFTHADDDRFALARLTVCADTSIAKVRAWLGGLDAPKSWRRERLRTTVFRQVRALRGR